MARIIVVTGTDTAVGKTFLTAKLVRMLNKQGVRAIALKPFVSGVAKKGSKRVWEDEEILKQANRSCPSGIGSASVSFSKYRAPLAPFRASLLEKKPIDFKKLKKWIAGFRKQCDILIIEGVGGLLCPLTEKITLADWIAKEKYPTLVVARLGLGTLNHTLLTVEAARRRKIKILGIILNDYPKTKNDLSHKWNPKDLANLTKIPILDVFPSFGKKSSADAQKA